MKKLFVVMALVVALATPTMAIETLMQGGFGLLKTSGDKANGAYWGGFTLPVMTMTEKGAYVKAEATYLYSDHLERTEVQVIRTMAYLEKSIVRGTRMVPGLTPTEMVMEVRWSIWLGGGLGSWTFTNTGIDGSQNDQTFGALGIRGWFYLYLDRRDGRC